MIGIPCAGKSTFSSWTNFPIVSSDSCIEKLCTENGVSYTEGFLKYSKQGFENFEQEIKNMISSGENFIWDQTNTSKRVRKEKIARLKRAGYKVCAVYFTCELALALERNKQRPGKFIPEHVITSMHAKYDHPCVSEGFDEIIRQSHVGHIATI
jgi:predicted kinase